MFKFLKINKNKIPPLNSFRSQIFDTNLFWFLGLGVCVLVFLIIVFVGSKLLYAQYFETYKKADSGDNADVSINIERIKKMVEKRNEFLNQKILMPKNPS